MPPKTKPSNTRRGNKSAAVNATRAAPRKPAVRNTNTLRNTRVIVFDADAARRTSRKTGSYPLAEISSDPLQVSISPIGIRRFVSGSSPLSMAFASHEQYFVHSVRFEFVPELAVTEPGSIHMSPDWDPLDPIPSSVGDMASEAGYKSGPVTQKLSVTMSNMRAPSGAPTRPMLYCSPNVTERLSDFGLLNVRTSGVTAAGTIGRIIMHYDMSFHIPVAPSILDYTLVPTLTSLQWVTPEDADQYRLSDVQYDNSTFRLLSNVHLYASKVYSGIVDTLGSIQLQTIAGRAVAEGSRIFFRTIKSSITTDGDAEGLLIQPKLTSNIIGALNLSRAFGALTEIVVKGTNAQYIPLLQASGINY